MNAVVSYIQMGDQRYTKYYFMVPLVVVLFLVIIVFIVLMTNAERRIPVQYAKRVVGRKMYGGQSTHIPIKVNMSGVLPIIFASSHPLHSRHHRRFHECGRHRWHHGARFLERALAMINTGCMPMLYFFLIMAFNYFYVAIQYNPHGDRQQPAERTTVLFPGIRPGKPTAEFIARVVSARSLLVGAHLPGYHRHPAPSASGSAYGHEHLPGRYFASSSWSALPWIPVRQLEIPDDDASLQRLPGIIVPFCGRGNAGFTDRKRYSVMKLILLGRPWCR